jgi:hypothetical protein
MVKVIERSSGEKLLKSIMEMIVKIVKLLVVAKLET